MSSVGTEFPKELERVRKLLAIYESIPEGRFGAMMIRQSIARAEAAQASGDVVAIVAAFQELKEWEE